MLDEPNTQHSSPSTSDPSTENEDRVFEDYRVFVNSAEFTRLMCEHVKKATRRAIEEGRQLSVEFGPRVNQ